MDGDQNNTGKLIWRFRKRDNLTQAELAEKVDVSVGQVSRWEKNKETPSKKSMASLARVFNIHVRLLSGNSEILHTDAPNTHSQQSEADKFQFEANEKTVARGRAHYFLHRFIAWYYGVDIWTRNEQTFPAVVFPIPRRVSESPQYSVLLPWDCSKASANQVDDWASFNKGFVDDLKNAGRSVDNRQTYCLEAIEFRNRHPFIRGGQIGYYEDCLATCDAMEWELLFAFGSNPPTTDSPSEFTRFADRNLPLRNAAKKACEEKKVSPYMSGHGRSAALAVSTLTMAKTTDGTYKTFLGHRSSKTASHARMLHVAPSGMLQPLWHWQKPSRQMHSAWYELDWSIKRLVLRELAEELFGRDFDDEFARKPPETPNVIFGFPEVQALDDLLADKKAEILVTAVLVNLLNLRPEIATLLLIKDATWFERHSRGSRSATAGLPEFQRNWEFIDQNDLQKQDLPDFWYSTVWGRGGSDLFGTVEERIGGITSSNFVTPGAITFFLGADRAREILSQ